MIFEAYDIDKTTRAYRLPHPVTGQPVTWKRGNSPRALARYGHDREVMGIGRGVDEIGGIHGDLILDCDLLTVSVTAAALWPQVERSIGKLFQEIFCPRVVDEEGVTWSQEGVEIVPVS